MTTYLLDPEALRAWIGLETYEGMRITELMAIGSQQVVFKVLGADGKSYVMKLPKSHIGFVIDLPPDGVFRINGDLALPHTSVIQVLNAKDFEYETKLNARLVSLCGSPLLSNVRPLDIIWQKLAFDLMQTAWYQFRADSRVQKPSIGGLFTKSKKPTIDRSTDPTEEHFARLARHKALIRCSFVLERLQDWAATDCSQPDEMIAIIAGDEAIHAGLPQLLVERATFALRNNEQVIQAIGAGRPRIEVEKNPFLPFIAAFSCSYTLPSESTGALARILDLQVNVSDTLVQLGQILHFLTPSWNGEQKSELISFVMGVASQCKGIGLEAMMMCAEELR